MKPAPFEDVDYKDPMTKFRVKSVVGKENDEEGVTTVSDAGGKALWKIDRYIGNYGIHLSKDGQYMILLGTYYFPETLKLSNEDEMAIVYKAGKRLKSFTVGDLLDGDAEGATAGLKVLGGGWIDMNHVIKNFKIDWKAQTITFELFNKKKKTFKFGA